jgi:hypothetical protein
MPAVDDVETSGQVVDESRVKLAETVGFSPDPGTGKLSGALPTFVSVAVCGLLWEPTLILAKLKLGGVAKSSSTTRLLPLSAMKTSPAASTAAP